ncbi:unnamed protein product [Strongylus vulgaris]|uniref:Cytochrome P450 n=1 Tax=Strongylus vulgaris TaxID=40348 RepID=A0A3P7K2U9_STRVU|nr:unnamed protein product [Strongylus vulgaris]
MQAILCEKELQQNNLSMDLCACKICKLLEIFQKYGNVHTIWFGPIPTVHICNYTSAVEAMIKKGTAFVNRALPYLFEYSRGQKNIVDILGGKGLLASSDEFWQEQRRFALHTLRNFGLGRNIIEERIMFEFEMTPEITIIVGLPCSSNQQRSFPKPFSVENLNQTPPPPPSALSIASKEAAPKVCLILPLGLLYSKIRLHEKKGEDSKFGIMDIAQTAE